MIGEELFGRQNKIELFTYHKQKQLWKFGSSSQQHMNQYSIQNQSLRPKTDHFDESLRPEISDQTNKNAKRQNMIIGSRGQ